VGVAIEIYARSCPACSRDVFAEKIAALDKLRGAGAI